MPYYVSITSPSGLWLICLDLALISPFTESWLLLMIMFLGESLSVTQSCLLSDILVLEWVPWLCRVGVILVLSSHLSLWKKCHLCVYCIGVKYPIVHDWAHIHKYVFWASSPFLSCFWRYCSIVIGVLCIFLMLCIISLPALSLWWCMTTHCDMCCLPLQLPHVSLIHHIHAAQLL